MPLVTLYASSDSADVIKLTNDAFVVFLVAFCFDATQCNASGVIKASGRQGLGSVCSLCCMLFLALPIGYFSAFYLNPGLCGLWLGYGFSAFVLSLLYATILIKMDWHKAAELA